MAVLAFGGVEVVAPSRAEAATAVGECSVAGQVTVNVVDAVVPHIDISASVATQSSSCTVEGLGIQGPQSAAISFSGTVDGACTEAVGLGKATASVTPSGPAFSGTAAIAGDPTEIFDVAMAGVGFAGNAELIAASGSTGACSPTNTTWNVSGFFQFTSA